jgi:hypothetical protein
MEIVRLSEDDIELDFEADLRAQDAWRESQLMQETGGLGSMARGILRPGGRHTIVCRHWLRDLCMKGDKCDFLHQYDLARMPECAQWSKFGKCPDNDCDFRHDTEKMECQKYKFGFCKLGSQCKMRHDKLTRSYLPETAPDWFLKEIIPNLFDFVPKLPEEIVRVSGVDDAPPLQPQPMAPTMGASMWQAPIPQVVHGTDQNWAAPAAPTWSVKPPPTQPGWNASKPVVDLTGERRRRDDERRAPGDRRNREREDRSVRDRPEPDRRPREREDEGKPLERHEKREDEGRLRDRHEVDRRTREDEHSRGRDRPKQDHRRTRDREEESRGRERSDGGRRPRDREDEVRARDRRDEDRGRTRRDDDRRTDRRRSRSYDRKPEERGRHRR